MKSTILSRYEQAQTLLQGVLNTHIAKNDVVYPHWVEGSHCFWYLSDTKSGNEFRLVNADTASNTLAFDHKAMADCLALATEQTVCADKLPIKHVTITLSPTQVCFKALGKSWQFDADTGTCKETISAQKIDGDSTASGGDASRMVEVFAQSLASPNGKTEIFIQDHNIWIRDRASGEESALTQTGNADESFACSSAFNVDPNTIQALWSPDSKHILTVQLDTKRVRDIYLRMYAPRDGSLHPQSMSFKMSYPSDEHVESYRLVIINVQAGHVQAVDYSQLPFVAHSDLFLGFFTLGLGWWSTDSQRAYFIDASRGSKVVRLVELDTDTGSTRVVFEEKSATFVKLRHDYCDRPHFLPLPETNELIWFSERSGWTHLYLYDLNTGQLKHQITGGASSADKEPLADEETSANKEPNSGQWLVRNLLHFNPVTREILVQTAARDPAISPYYRDVCKINIDTCLLTPLVSGNFDHEVSNKNSMAVATRDALDIDNKGIGINGVSPDGEFIVVTRARVDTIPVSFIIDKKGKELFTVETADISGLPEGWHWPEPVKLKAADNQTDIYGVVFRPPNFSTDDQYPILEYSSVMRNFSGLPQGSFSLAPFLGAGYYQPAALAALGFIVVVIEGRGSPLRDKAFQDHRFGELAGTSDLDDRMAGIHQLAKRYPYMDINRVGITSTEIPGNAIYGLLHPSDFYSVVVLHVFNDPRYSMSSISEIQDGTVDKAVINNCSYPEDHLDHFSGKLFLIQGMLSPGVAGSFRLVEALQKANLTFDMLCLPNLMNQMTSYTIRREWDYLVTHLQELEPPKDFKLVTGEDLFYLNKNNL